MNENVAMPIEATVGRETAVDEAGAIDAVGKTFGIRALAYLIDTAAIYVASNVVAFAVGVAVGLYLAMSGRSFPTDAQLPRIVGIATGLLSTLAYFTLLEGLFGATLGKLLTGMRVVREDGSPCGLWPALQRGLWRFVDGLIFGIVAYGTMKAPWQQRLGDKHAHTLVLGKRSPHIQQQRHFGWLLLAAAGYGVISAVLTSVQLAFMLG